MKYGKKFLFASFLAVVLAFSASCGQANAPAESSSSAQLANPFEDCADMNQAKSLAGFDLALPKPADQLQAVKDKMIQALYGKDGSDMLIRKAKGSDDISGDSTEYKTVESADGVTLKGDGKLFYLAVWTKDSFSYSVFVKAGASKDELLSIAKGVH